MKIQCNICGEKENGKLKMIEHLELHLGSALEEADMAQEQIDEINNN